ncbi:MAG: hypothetical protein DMF40_10465 [Verrucomicrobia bacterium]|nr:MAG: hypothetical protein DMF40_10465 [Verrucomicrobiota bacterium]
MAKATFPGILWAWKLLKKQIMNGNGHLTVSTSAAKRVRRTKSNGRKPKTRSRNGNGTTKVVSRDLPAAGTLARTKALLLAALRVWELKHRVTD